MALKSRKITKKELTVFYQPLTTKFETMVNSINSQMGYGQTIQRYNGTEVLNTYYHVWSDTISGEVVIDAQTTAYYPISQAGPILWGVTSQEGINFLNGTFSIKNYRKFKYCNSCQTNTPNFQSIDNFAKRFKELKVMMDTYRVLDGYLFYDTSLTRFANVFPSIKEDDGVNIRYRFKNIQGVDKTPEEISIITGQPINDIEVSIDDAPIIKPQEGSNTVITSCCDESISYVISGQYTIGSILQLDGIPPASCWYVESLTNELPNSGMFAIMGEQRSCVNCISKYPCPTNCEPIDLTYSTDPESACLGRTTTYQIDWSNNFLYNNDECGGSSPRYGYYSDGKFVYSWDGVTFEEYDTCSTNTSSAVTPCCDGPKGIIEGVYPVGTVLYTKDMEPASCFTVVSNGTDEPTLPYTFTVWRGGDCKGCTNNYPGGC